MQRFALALLLAACGGGNSPDIELCDDGVDNNFDGLVDCDDPTCQSEPACLLALPESDATGDIDPANGDPALDIVASGMFETSSGEIWVRVELNAAWPPSSSLFSWFIQISIDDEALSRLSIITEVHDGVPDTRTEGGIALADTDLVFEPSGVRVLFGDPTFVPVNYRIETGVLRTEGGLFVQDTAGPFNVTPVPAEFPAE